MYLLAALAALIISVSLAAPIKRWAEKKQLVDYPAPRKLHLKPTILGGGWAIFLSFTIISWLFAFFSDQLLGKDISIKQLIAVTIAALFIMIGGYLDDRYNLSPAKQFIWPLLAAITIVFGGIGVNFVSNPLGGGLLHLDSVKIEILSFSGLPYYFTLWADLFTILWLLGMMYTTKLLDGLDGLVPGIGVIGSFVIFGLTQTEMWRQLPIGLLAIILAGACLGFLIWNWHPAKLFLGEGGSLYIGFMLGVLAIISGGKIATALLVMGIPILDVVWVILRRLFWDKKKITEGDSKHLHYRLLDVGLSHRQSVLFLFLLTAAFGVSSLFLHTQGKLLALLVLVAVMLILAFTLVLMYKRKIKKGQII
ncbi:MAG: MraY family glycosyltransferase [Patescibacteria group bacterium]